MFFLQRKAKVTTNLDDKLNENKIIVLKLSLKCNWCEEDGYLLNETLRLNFPLYWTNTGMWIASKIRAVPGEGYDFLLDNFVSYVHNLGKNEKILTFNSFFLEPTWSTPYSKSPTQSVAFCTISPTSMFYFIIWIFWCDNVTLFSFFTSYAVTGLNSLLKKSWTRGT